MSFEKPFRDGIFYAHAFWCEEIRDLTYAVSTWENGGCNRFHGVPNSWDHLDPSFDRFLFESKRSSSEARFKPEYEALSYAWGSREYPVTAFV